MNTRALDFETGGTAFDGHGGSVRAVARVGARGARGARGAIERDWHAMANDGRRRTMKRIVGRMQPAFHMDDVHRRTLVLRELGPPRLVVHLGLERLFDLRRGPAAGISNITCCGCKDHTRSGYQDT